MEFTSPWGKLIRARDLMSQLVEIGHEHRSSDPYEYNFLSNENDSSDRLIRMQWRVKVKKNYPQEASWLLGDIVNNIRSSLDHAVAAVARKKFGFDEDGISGKKRLQFPIADTPGKLGRRELRHWFPDDVINVIEEHQPYMDKDPDLSPLGMLRDLSNMDKHRALMVADRAMVHVNFTASPEPKDLVIKKHAATMEDGQAVLTVKFARPLQQIEMDVRPEFHSIESVRAPGMDNWLPLALSLELIYEAAFGAVWDLTKDIMNEHDHAFARIFLSQTDERTKKIREATGIEHPTDGDET
ncbi:hypothetical protein ABIE37_000945 [Arthrobacter bambusae]|uniref:Uncharacterized protein n=1 Tax=Arthrobacter bambusae TaxID=1338426 RepID=A0ABV2P349_9MICC